MLRKAINTLVYVATAIMLLHSLVPHHHHVDEEQHVLAATSQPDKSSLVELLRDIFGLDLGSEHLDNFNSSRYTDGLISPVFVMALNQCFFPSLISEEETIHHQTRFVASLHEAVMRPAIVLRGPPAQVN